MLLNKRVKWLASKQAWLVPLFFFCAALLVRIVYLNQIQNLPLIESPVMDERYHVDLAREILNPTGPPDEPFFRAPLYPYFLSALMKIAGDSLYRVRLLQLILGSILPLLIFGLGLKLFNRKIAFWAAALAVFYPTFIYYDAALLITSQMVILSVLLIWQLYRCEKDHRTVNFVIAGVLLSIAGLARPNILLFGPALLIWTWVTLKPILGTKKALLSFVIIGVASVLTIVPVTVRNYVVADDPVFIAWQGGFNFYLGNNRNATGWSATAEGIDQTWQGGYLESIAIAEQNAGRRLMRSEVSDYWFGRGFDEIAADPGQFVSLVFRKLRYFFNGYEIPNNQNIYMVRDHSSLARLLMHPSAIYFPYGLLAPLALIGLVLSLGNWRKYLILYLFSGSYLISLLLFFVCARFRQPMLPIMLLFAVLAIERLFFYFKRKDVKNAALFLVVFVLLGWESNHDMLELDKNRLRAQDHLMIANAYYQSNRLGRASFEFRAAIKDDSTLAQAHHNLGIVNIRQGEMNQAIKSFRTAIALEPLQAEAYLSLATSYLDRRFPDSALGVLKLAQSVQPLNYLVQLKLSMTYFELGYLDSALAACQRSLRLNRNDPVVNTVYRELLQAKNK